MACFPALLFRGIRADIALLLIVAPVLRGNGGNDEARG